MEQRAPAARTWSDVGRYNHGNCLFKWLSDPSRNFAERNAATPKNSQTNWLQLRDDVLAGPCVPRSETGRGSRVPSIQTAKPQHNLAMLKYRGRRAVAIENDRVRVTVLEGGGHIAEVLDKRTGVNPLWTPPWPSIEPEAYDPAHHPEYR